MKRLLFPLIACAIIITACNEKASSPAASSTSSTIKLPYEAGYTSNFTNNVSDSNLLLVLNTYKYWEAADMVSMRTTMGDSMSVEGATGFIFNGRTDSLIGMWKKSRDSLSSVKVSMEVWTKNHSVKDSMDYIITWYKEIDTYATGRIDSAKYSDINGIRNGKVVYFSQYKQALK